MTIDAATVFTNTHPDYYYDTSADAYWKKYDANHDGVVDTFWLMYAGVGQESGGGALGEYALWSHSSDLRGYSRWQNGFKVYEGDPATTADDIVIGPYTMQPENTDLGVIVEEFGHNFFGLPDLYTNDADNSIGFWSEMAGGSWAGYLGGATPVGMPLWFRMIAVCGTDSEGNYVPCNWQQPMQTVAYNTPAAEYAIGQLEDTPAGVNKGYRINMPPIVETIPNQAGAGKGAYTGSGIDDTWFRLDREVAVPATGSAILTFASYWKIEDGWDYGYVYVKDGANWTMLDDLDGKFAEDDPNGNNLGHGLTGAGQAVLRFDLSAYKGKTVTIRLAYKTDAASTEAGWWVDDVRLDETLVDDFAAATEPNTFPGWTNSGWTVVPTTKNYSNYYLVEWRSTTKYDSMLRTAYHTTYNDVDGWRVDRVPYNIPGALIYYRNAKYFNTYALLPNQFDGPSIGPKYQLLAVDVNPAPLRIDPGGTYSTTVFTTRRSSYDAALTLQPSEAFTLTGLVTADGNITQNFPIASKPAVTSFNDTKGYYAGFYTGTPCPVGRVCYAAQADSAVIPARDTYTTRITRYDGTPYYAYFGRTVAGSELGSGYPGDNNVQYGLNIDLLSKSADNTTATLRISNYSVDMVSTAPAITGPGAFETTYHTWVRNSGTEIATNVAVTYTLDTSLSLVSFEASAGTASAATKSWSIDSLAPGQVVTLTVKAAGTSLAPRYLTTRIDGFDGKITRGPWFKAQERPFGVFMPLTAKQH